jgi:adenine-specific DNA-methyltransferase
MPDQRPDPLPKTTPDITDEQIEKLKRIFPECVTEDGHGPAIDFDLLRATLGEVDALAGDDAYTFTWAGKEEAFRAIQTPSGASLAPVPEESVNWDETRHLFIEGENLEVLKLLYKSYFGRVKMIYIDPPYNTGNDFIYRDDYSEPRRAYLEKTGQMDAEGNVLTSNPETSGRYHSDWLTMMYPRLFLARQLLREDGIMLVSIDDVEIANLKLMLNMIFGEENLLAHIVWQKRYVSNVTARWISDMHDHILVYGRDKEKVEVNRLPRTEQQLQAYKNPDDDPRGPWRPQDLSASKPYSAGLYTITTPTGRKVKPPPGRYWRCSRKQYEEWLADDRIWFGKSGEGRPMLKAFLSEAQKGVTPNTWWEYEFAGHNKEATLEMKELFDGGSPFDTAKPVRLVRRMVELFTDPDSLVLDFFAGSATTAHAVIEHNRSDGGSRQFIMVQLAESVDTSSETGENAKRLGLETIADIGKERVRRAIDQIHSGDEMQLDLRPEEDLGFKVFKLAPSTFREWEPPEGEAAEALEEQLALFDRGVEEGAEPTDVIYEVILKLGYSLNARIEPLEVESNRVYRVVDEVGESGQATAPFFVCLDDELADETIDALPLDKETTFVCLDTALDDSQKVNLAMGCLLKVI